MSLSHLIIPVHKNPLFLGLSLPTMVMVFFIFYGAFPCFWWWEVVTSLLVFCSDVHSHHPTILSPQIPLFLSLTKHTGRKTGGCRRLIFISTKERSVKIPLSLS
ncbi:hypothetical protein Hanom_Chr02g00106211 [Helianthus anomalus]